MMRVCWLMVAVLSAAWSGALAQDFPSGPVKILVPFAAGGPTDVIMRILADQLTTRWGKPVLVENRPGAGTILATTALAKSPPDGLTLAVATNSFVINPAISHNLPYDTLLDFAGVSMVVHQPMVLVANPEFPANTIAEVVAEARKATEPLNYTSPGPRSTGHLAGEWLQSLTGIKLVHIGYNGSAPALTDVLGGRVPLMFDIWHSAKPHVEAGKLKVIAVTGERMRDAPRYPTIGETFPGFNAVAFQALIAPAGVPPAVLDQISADVRAIVASPEFLEKIKPFGVDPGGTTPGELDTWLRAEIAKIAGIAKAANLKVD
jgi:tripartite-type tricarboxylate transporter receptor subunit TctC